MTYRTPGREAPAPRPPAEPSPRPPAVIILWAEEWPVERFHTVAYYSGKGHVRVYPRDAYDARLVLGELRPLPYFDDPRDAAEHIASEARRAWQGEDAVRRLEATRSSPPPGSFSSDAVFASMCQVEVRAVLELGFRWEELDPLALATLGVARPRGRRARRRRSS